MTPEPTGYAVGRELCNRILVITVDNPPVNALGANVRRQLRDAIEAAEKDPDVDAVLLVGAGRNFIGGADIREFGKPPLPPSLPDVCNTIEACRKPVVAAIHGAALGGGLEVAVAAHYRIALGAAKLGLPEVTLGLLPGAGGTQRAPRLDGAKATLDLMLSGRHVGAKEAHAFGLVDRICETDDVLAEGLAYVQALLDAQAPVRLTRDADGLADLTASRAAIEAARAETSKKSHGLFSPLKIVDAVQAALELPFDDGLRHERQLFLQCLDSPQRAGLIHAFLAEREVLKAPETRNAKPRKIASVGVVGGGTMGAGIAVAVLDAGLPVTMIERDAVSLARGLAHIEKVYDNLIAKGRMTPEAKSRTGTGTPSCLPSCVSVGLELSTKNSTWKTTCGRNGSQRLKTGFLLPRSAAVPNLSSGSETRHRARRACDMGRWSRLLSLLSPLDGLARLGGEFRDGRRWPRTRRRGGAFRVPCNWPTGSGSDTGYNSAGDACIAARGRMIVPHLNWVLPEGRPEFINI
ncbi:enoyl-CoA hydratase/carnithine racemase [Paraburkholderia sp. 32]